MKKWLNLSISNARLIAEMGILIALDIVFTRFLSITTLYFRLGFAFLVLLLSGMRLGPVHTAVVAALADLIGAHLFPVGPYFPGFTVTAAINGFLYGLFFFDGFSWKGLALFLFLEAVVVNLGLQTLWIVMLNHTPYGTMLLTRIPTALAMLALKAIMIPQFNRPQLASRLRRSRV